MLISNFQHSEASLSRSLIPEAAFVYVLVEQDERRLDILWRHETVWAHESLENEAEFFLPCVDAPLTLAEIYAGVNVSSPVYRGDIYQAKGAT